MTLHTFIANNEVEYSKNLIKKNDLLVVSEYMGAQIGEELTEYILRYGYLAYRHSELYGVNARQFLDSDMVRQTVYLHRYFPETKNYIALENRGDGDYFLVDENDHVYEFDTEIRNFTPLKIKLYEHILQRFKALL